MKHDALAALPSELNLAVMAQLDVKALLCLQQCDQRLQSLAGSDKVWRAVFMGRFGLPSKNQDVAHKLAKSWQALYKSKVLTDQAAGQWRKPSPYEVQAALQTMLLPASTPPAGAATATSPDAGTAVTAAKTTTTSVDTSSPADTAGTSASARASGAPSHTASALAGEEEGGGGDDDNSSPPARQASVSSTTTTTTSSGGSDGGSRLSSSGSIDSATMNNEGVAAAGVNVCGKTQLSVIFMLDSSGSVGEEDFSCMTEFLDTAAQAVAGMDNCKVCVVQFSNDTRVEVPLGPLDKPAFDTAVRSMVRLNGGTNIAAAVAKAGALLKADEADCSDNMRRVLVLLTDGRIDGYQAREAAAMVSRLSDEQSNVALWAFGVGRGVDSEELIRIIEGCSSGGVGGPRGDVSGGVSGGAEAAGGGGGGGGASGDGVCGSKKGVGRERYMDLCVRDDAPW